MNWLIVLVVALLFHAIVMFVTMHEDIEMRRVVRRVDAVLTAWAKEWGGDPKATRVKLLEALRKHGADV